MSSALRTQFLDYMTLHRFSRHTKKNYILVMQGLTRFYNQSPDILSEKQIEKYLLYLIEEKKLAWGSVNNCLQGIACFYKNVLKWDETRFKIPPRPSGTYSNTARRCQTRRQNSPFPDQI